MVNRAIVETKIMANVEKKRWFYQAKIRTENEDKIYVGLSANEIKKRILVHETTFKCRPEDENYHKYINSTELSKTIHQLK